MSRGGAEKSVFYFDDEGRSHMKQAARLAAKRGKELAVENYVVFTRDGSGAIELLKHLKGTGRVIATTFPYRQTVHTLESGGLQERTSDTLSAQAIAELAEAGVRLVRGTAPFTESFFIPGVSDPKLEGIRYALQLLSSGLHLCVQAVTMAVDAGEIEPGVEVISMSADTAIVAKASSTRYLFHPQVGMEIREIICKPRSLTLRQRPGV